MTINEKTYNVEIEICKKHYKQGFCNWGKCTECGVVPLLHKMYNKEIVDDAEEIDKLKKQLLG